jgi:DNA-directed RNA polymerase alpha subunit
MAQAYEQAMCERGIKYMKMKGIFAKMNRHDQQESDLPTELASPARRALVGAGYVRLEQLTRLSEADVLHLHGMGPKAMDQLRRALAARGLSFTDRKKSQAKGEG